MTKRVLCLLVDGFEEIETLTPVDVLRRAGVEVGMVSLAGRMLTGRCGVRIEADALLGEMVPAEFDLLLIPGGPGVGELRRDGRAAALARQFAADGKSLAAICAAPLVLKDAGLLEGKRFTAHHSVRAELGACSDERVVVDGGIITSRGAGTALDFALAVVTLLCGGDAADRVAAEIMA